MLNKLSVTYNNNSISLENISTLAILGDNGVGKTSFLERIALTNEDNITTILNAKGSINYENFSVSIDDEELTSSPPWKGEGSLPGGSSFPPSIRDYISHLVGSRVAQRTTPI